jgi:nucleoid DNA-binding protein
MQSQAEVETGAKTVYKTIESCLQGEKGCTIGRFGSTEFANIWTYEMNRQIPENQRLHLEYISGIFPPYASSVEKWVLDYKTAFQDADVLALGWYPPTVAQELELMKRWKWSGDKVLLRSLEPYYVNPALRYTNLFKGQSVCVVNSFTETMKGQVLKGESVIWPGANTSMWPPGITWHFVQTGYPPVLALGQAGWECAAESWEEAVEWSVGETLKTGARIVILGCGGLAMCMARRLKAAGKICIVLGGATQVLFGVKGKRWENHGVISKFWNDEWVWPSEEETPGAADLVEGGCYWRSAS